MAMKRAKASTYSVEITCPYCKETIPNPDNGGLYWEVTQLHDEVTCPDCGKTSLAPKIVGWN